MSHCFTILFMNLVQSEHQRNSKFKLLWTNYEMKVLIMIIVLTNAMVSWPYSDFLLLYRVSQKKFPTFKYK